MTQDGPVEYEPVSVKSVLRDMKDTAELLIDLAFSSVLFDSNELAEEVLALEREMDILQMRARMSLLMAARNPDDAEALAPVLGVVGAAEKVSDAAGDIAKVVREEISPPAAIRDALPDAVETLARAEAGPESAYTGRRLGEISLETETGVRVIAIRRGDEWLLDVDRDTIIRAGDVLLCRGPAEGIAGVYQTLTGDAFDPPTAASVESSDLRRATEAVVLMKNMSELAVDLAYGSLLFDDMELAEEVRNLEVEVDGLQARFEAWVLQSAASDSISDPVSLRGLMRIGAGTEVISDAAVEISEGVLRGVGTHPVVAEAVEESDEVIVRTPIRSGSQLDGTTIGEERLGTRTGVRIIAVRRGPRETDPEGQRDRMADTSQGDWLLSPQADTRLDAEDVLIAKGTRAGTDRLTNMAT